MSTSFYEQARQRYADCGVDTEAALSELAQIPISIHCWQGDDIGGFEGRRVALEDAGLQATGKYPGKARTTEELRSDLQTALSLIPGTHRVNLHAMYADSTGKTVDRDLLTPDHFQPWIDWARAGGVGLDFNPTFFAHPLAQDGLTLTHPEEKICSFWIQHGRAARRIAAEIGRQLASPCVCNVWIPDGSKDLLFDRKHPRLRLEQSLDAIFSESLDPTQIIDCVESKLFGIGSESYVAGSHEFYLGYAISRKIALCLDSGHFHPTESLADKISAILQFVPEILLHVSRGIRWDSDHVVILEDPTRALFEEVIRGDFLSRTHIGLDFFDASINRLAGWIIGARAAQKGLLLALLEPATQLRNQESQNDFTSRLAWFEALKTLPYGAVWEEFCLRYDVPPDPRWMEAIQHHEKTVLAQRS